MERDKMGYEPRDRTLTIRTREAERDTWRRAAAVQGYGAVSSWARAVLNLAARQVLEAATEEAPVSELRDGR